MTLSSRPWILEWSRCFGFLSSSRKILRKSRGSVAETLALSLLPGLFQRPEAGLLHPFERIFTPVDLVFVKNGRLLRTCRLPWRLI